MRITTDDALREIYERATTIAVVGASNDPSKASFQIGRYLKDNGFRIVPVNPKGGEILGERAYRSLEEIDVPIDVVDVFRPPEEGPAIAAQAARLGAKVVWFQPETGSAEAEQAATDAGLDVVMDACMGETHARLGLGAGPYAQEVVEIDPKTKRWTLIAVILGSGVVFLDSTIVNVALPQIGRELHSSLLNVLEAQSYIYYGYLLSLSALLILAGALTDYFGRRKVFTIGLAGFAITSAMCGLAPNLEILILFRVLQGAAGAVLVPGTLSIITATFHGEEQGRAFGTWAGASAATTILGPVVGGALVTSVSWRAAFLINLPIVAIALWATTRYVKETRDDQASGHFHWSGAALVAIAVGGLTFGTIRGQAAGWTEPLALVPLIAGALAALSLPAVMRRSDHPLIPPSLFRSRNFTVTNISTFLIYGAIYVTFNLLPLFAISILGYNAVAFGAATIPGTLFMALFSARFGALAARHGPRVFMAVGPTLMGLGLLWFARIPENSVAWVVQFKDPSTFVPPNSYLVDVLPGMVLFGLGLMVMVAPLTTALMRSVPERNAGVASAVNNAISRVGPQIAGALLFVLISARFYASLADRVPGLDVAARAFRERVAPLNPASGVGAQVAAAAREASTEAFHVAMVAAALLCFAGAMVNWVGIRNEAAQERAPSELVCPGIGTPGVESRPDGRAA
jgi:EmrB/QacA subfamily drug resistance transporter